MLKISDTQVFGWDAAIRGMRNPMNSWAKSDSYWTHVEDPETLQTAPFEFFLGDADLALAHRLAQAGPEHAKFLRFIYVQADVVAPEYWWKEYSTYKIGTAENSTSTMHKLTAKSFEVSDFSFEDISPDSDGVVTALLDELNDLRDIYLNGTSYLQKHDKDIWRMMIQLLPMSYNYRRTITLNYQVLANMYRQRRNHKLIEWHVFCDWIETLPYFKEIVLDD